MKIWYFSAPRPPPHERTVIRTLSLRVKSEMGNTAALSGSGNSAWQWELCEAALSARKSSKQAFVVQSHAVSRVTSHEILPGDTFNLRFIVAYLRVYRVGCSLSSSLTLISRPHGSGQRTACAREGRSECRGEGL